MKIASISELKDSLSAHLDLVRAGELVVVTDRKAPVATLTRITPGSLPGALRRLVAEGILAPAVSTLDLRTFFEMPSAKVAGGLSATVLDERNQER